MSKFNTIITGADGYVGLGLVIRYLNQQTPVRAWVHAGSTGELDAKKAAMQPRLSANGLNMADCNELAFASGSLSDADPFRGVDPSEVETFIHSAAVTRFNVDEVTARTTNLEGTQKALQFAERCKNLKRFVFISTLYASGLASGVIEEKPFPEDGRRFANHYERSKWASERLLLEQYAQLPWQIARVATIIADNDQGVVTQQNAFHNTLKLVYYGLLSVMPGTAETPLYLVPGNFVTDAIYAIAQSDRLQSIFNVSYRPSESATLGQLLDTAFTTFEQDDTFKRRRVLKPLYADIASFNVLATTLSTLGQGVMSQAMSSVAPFAEQLFVRKEIANANLVSLLPHYQAPNAVAFIESTCRHLVSTRWGRAAEVANR